MLRSILLLSLLSISSLLAEIEQVVVVWRAKNCDQSCEERIVERLEAASQIESASVIPGAGQAVVKWKPDTPFSYSPLNIAMRRVGPSIQMVQMVVSGKVRDDGKNIILTSTGDNSSFTLLNPVGAQDVGIAVQGTTRGRELPEDLKNRLIQAQKNGQIVTVKGNLFNPFRAPPQMLIIESTQFSDK